MNKPVTPDVERSWDRRFKRHDIMLAFSMALLLLLGSASVFIPEAANTLSVAIASGAFASMIINLLIIVMGSYLDDKETRKAILEIGKSYVDN